MCCSKQEFASVGSNEITLKVASNNNHVSRTRHTNTPSHATTAPSAAVMQAAVHLSLRACAQRWAVWSLLLLWASHAGLLVVKTCYESPDPVLAAVHALLNHQPALKTVCVQHCPCAELKTASCVQYPWGLALITSLRKEKRKMVQRVGQSLT